MSAIKQKYYFISALISALIIPSVSLAFQVTYEPRVTLSEEYTDNLDLTEDDTESDVITTIQPGFTISALGQSRGLNLSYDPSYSWYAEHGENDTLRHDARLDAWSNVSRNARLTIDNTFLYTEDPGTDPQTDTVIEDRSGRDPYYRNTATLGFSNQFGPADAVTLAYRHSLLENEDDDVEDSQEHTPSLSWSYGVSNRISAQGTAAFTRGEFDESDDFERYQGSLQLNYQVIRNVGVFASYQHTTLFYDQSEDENYQVNYPSAGLDYQAGEGTRISIAVGNIWVEREKEDDEEGLLFTSDVTQTLQFRRGALSLTGSSGYDESYFDEDNLGLRIFYQAGGVFTYEMLKDISARLAGSYRSDTYLNTDDDQEDHTTTGSVGLVFNRIRYVSAVLSYDYRLLDSTSDGEGYEENRFSFTITIRPDPTSRRLLQNSRIELLTRLQLIKVEKYIL
jgi:hypothetical protein